MEETEIEQKVRQLSPKEAEVLYWVYTGLQLGQVGINMGLGEEMLSKYMERIYDKFGIDKKLHWTKKRDELEKFKTTFQKHYTLGGKWPTDTGDTQPNKIPVKITPPILYILLIGVMAVMMVAVGIIAYALGKNTVVQAPTVFVTKVITATLTPTIQPTEVPIVIPTVALSPTIQPVYTRVPIILESTNTPLPISTASPLIHAQGEDVTITPGVFITLHPNFGDPNFGLCEVYSKSGFEIGFDINNTNSSQFLLRFDWKGFKVLDNTGKNYPLIYSGIGGCSGDPGLRSATLNQNNSTTIEISLSGELGLDVKYLTITIENISGYGSFIFRKDI